MCRKQSIDDRGDGVLFREQAKFREEICMVVFDEWYGVTPP